ncbi:MAG: hypothetical protein WAR24_03770 [Candidatus Acidiferrales bacterium]
MGWRRLLIWSRNLETAAMVPVFALDFLKLGTNIAELALFIGLAANLLSYLVTVLHVGVWVNPARLASKYAPRGQGLWSTIDNWCCVTAP